MVQAVAQFASSRAIKNEQKLWPDIQHLLFASAEKIFTKMTPEDYLAIDETLLKEFRAPTVGKEGFHILAMLSRPHATGEILLKATDFKDTPLLNPKYYLEDKENTDIDVIAEGWIILIYFNSRCN